MGVGFLLGEGSRYIRYRSDISRNKKLVRAELQSILSQIPQKRDIINQAIKHLNQDRFLTTLSVRSVTTGYYSVVEALYPHLSLIDRNCLHVIFERIRVADDVMEKFEDSFIKAMKDKIIPNVSVTYAERLKELLESFIVIEQLTKSYLADSSIDVFGIEQVEAR